MVKTDNMISGLEYWRRKKRVTVAELIENAKMGKINPRVWADAEHILKSSDSDRLVRAADYLGVTVDELLTPHRSSELLKEDRGLWRCKSRDPKNCISNYRVEKRLTYSDLGKRLGVTRQAAQQLCGRASMRSIRRVCALEGISQEEFMARYGNEETA